MTNAAALQGEVAVQDILPGQQLTAADFAVSTSGVVGQLTLGQRAVSVALDPEHGLVGDVEPGDHVDVYGDFGGSSGSTGSGGTVVKLLIPNALVLKTPSRAAASASSRQRARCRWP